jgi:Cdc6-like AAA superfamily ATPase
MIYLISGKPGTGKTYTATKLAYDFLMNGRDVYANYDINFTPYVLHQRKSIYHKIKRTFKYFTNTLFDKQNKKPGKIYRWETIEDFKFIEQGVILLDEGHIWINSRQWEKLPPEIHYKASQHRKDGIDMYIITQNPARIDKVFRELANDVLQMHKFAFWFWYNIFDVEEIDKEKKKSHGFKIFPFSKPLAQSYDTLHKVISFEKKEFPMIFEFEQLSLSKPKEKKLIPFEDKTLDIDIGLLQNEIEDIERNHLINTKLSRLKNRGKVANLDISPLKGNIRRKPNRMAVNAAMW